MTAAIDVYKHRDNTIPIDWQDENSAGIDMTGYTLTGSIDWAGGTLSITSMLSYLTQASGSMQLAIPAASAALLPDGAASTMTVIGTVGSNAYYIIDAYPVFGITI